MNPTRRDFLERAGRASLVVGLSSFGFGCSQRTDGRERPAALNAAFARMRAERKPAFVFRFGEDVDGDRELVHTISSLVDDVRGVEACELLALAMFICLESSGVDAWIAESRSQDDVQLIDERGRRLDGIELAKSDRRDPRAMLKTLRLLVRGVNGSRVRMRAENARRELPHERLQIIDAFLAESSAAWRPTVDAALGRWTRRDREQVEALRELIIALPMLAAAHETPTDGSPLEYATAPIFCGYLETFEEFEAGPVLPYGLALVSRSGDDCARPKHGDKSIQPLICGTAFFQSPAVHRFVGLLARESAPR